MASTTRPVARAENVGSLLQPAALLQGRQQRQDGTITADELSAIEDTAILDVVKLQESVGLDVITDGEFRRTSWAHTVKYLDGIEPRPGQRSYPANIDRASVSRPVSYPTVVGRISPKASTPFESEFGFLQANTSGRAKYTIAAPSYHRRYWSDDTSPKESPYETCEEFLTDVRDWIRTVAIDLIAGGATYIQIDAPNYGSLCDPNNRAFHAEQGHNLDEQIAFDAKLDSSVFTGLDVTSGIHVCRGNLPGGEWHSQGGYNTIADPLFPNLNIDSVLMEYDTDRAGDFSPITRLQPHSTAVLGLLTTKEATLEDKTSIHDRINEATKVRPLGQLALSTQCGFGSAANAPMTEAEQRDKLHLITTLAHEIWG